MLDEEVEQLRVAYEALKSQPRLAQLRMLAWLQSRLHDDYEKAMNPVSAGVSQDD